MLAALTSPQLTGPPPRAVPGPGAEALASLFQEHHERVYRAAHRITGNASDAEDVLQTVFIRLLRRQDDVDLGDGAASYLHRAAVNASLDLIRARKRARAVDLAEVSETPAEGADSAPESRRYRRELSRLLRAALTKVSPRAAEIFSLRYFEGFGNREIAELLGTSQTAVAVILHRTRHRLGKELVPLLGGNQP